MKETTEGQVKDQKKTAKDWFKKLPSWKKVGIAVLFSPFYFAYRGFIASVLYGWLVLPTFPMLPNMNMWQAAGITLVVAQFGAPRRETKIKEEFLDEDKKHEIFVMYSKPFVVLFFGYLIHLMIL